MVGTAVTALLGIGLPFLVYWAVVGGYAIWRDNTDRLALEGDTAKLEWEKAHELQELAEEAREASEKSGKHVDKPNPSRFEQGRAWTADHFAPANWRRGIVYLTVFTDFLQLVAFSVSALPFGSAGGVRTAGAVISVDLRNLALQVVFCVAVVLYTVLFISRGVVLAGTTRVCGCLFRAQDTLEEDDDDGRPIDSTNGTAIAPLAIPAPMSDANDMRKSSIASARKASVVPHAIESRKSSVTSVRKDSGVSHSVVAHGSGSSPRGIQPPSGVERRLVRDINSSSMPVLHNVESRGFDFPAVRDSKEPRRQMSMPAGSRGLDGTGDDTPKGERTDIGGASPTALHRATGDDVAEKKAHGHPSGYSYTYESYSDDGGRALLAVTPLPVSPLSGREHADQTSVPVEASLQDIVKAMGLPGGVVISAHRHHFHKFRACFVGSEAVGYLLKHNYAIMKEDAVVLLQRMLDMGYLECLNGGSTFHASSSGLYRMNVEARPDLFPWVGAPGEPPWPFIASASDVVPEASLSVPIARRLEKRGISVHDVYKSADSKHTPERDVGACACLEEHTAESGEFFLLNFISPVMLDTLLIPFVRMAFRMLACAYPTPEEEAYAVLSAAPAVRCWHSGHFVLAFCAGSFILAVYPAAIHEAYIKNDLDPEFRYVPKFHVIFAMVKILLITCQVLLEELPGAYIFSVFITVGGLTLGTLWLQPALGSGAIINHWRAATFGGAWFASAVVGITLLAVGGAPPPQDQSPGARFVRNWLSVVLFSILLGPLMYAFGALSHQREEQIFRRTVASINSLEEGTPEEDKVAVMTNLANTLLLSIDKRDQLVEAGIFDPLVMCGDNDPSAVLKEQCCRIVSNVVMGDDRWVHAVTTTRDGAVLQFLTSEEYLIGGAVVSQASCAALTSVVSFDAELANLDVVHSALGVLIDLMVREDDIATIRAALTLLAVIAKAPKSCDTLMTMGFLDTAAPRLLRAKDARTKIQACRLIANMAVKKHRKAIVRTPSFEILCKMFKKTRRAEFKFAAYRALKRIQTNESEIKLQMHIAHIILDDYSPPGTEAKDSKTPERKPLSFR